MADRFRLTVCLAALLAPATVSSAQGPGSPPGLPPEPSRLELPAPDAIPSPRPLGVPQAPTAPPASDPLSAPAQVPGSLPPIPPVPQLPTPVPTQPFPTPQPAPFVGEGPVITGPQGFQPVGMPGRFHAPVDPKTPAKELLPAAPLAKLVAWPAAGTDLRGVPEVTLAEALPRENAQQQTAQQIARVNVLDQKSKDGFVEALLAHRADLAGLPFAMGDACRTTGDTTRYFTQSVNLVRQALASTGKNEGFWTQYAALCAQQDQALPQADRACREHVAAARIAALTQIMAPEHMTMRLGLVKHLTATPHVEATRALARMAIFSPEDGIRSAALDALKVRREKDYTSILVAGLRYPFPAVAKRAADAIARLERADLIPELVAVLDEADPRVPVTKRVGGKDVTVARELVKLNHHRNCVMCHAPANTGTVSGDALQVQVAIPGEPLEGPSGGYRPATSPDLMIRVDVTYLRPDFSVLMPVADAHPWPEMQRFDFIVRERPLTAVEATVWTAAFTPKGAGAVSPYHRAVLAALREMTGKDAAPTAAAWRAILDLPRNGE